MEYIKKPVLTPEAPGEWGSHGSLFKTRMDVDAFFSAASGLKNQLDKGTLDPSSLLAHVSKLRRHLDILEQHGSDPTKYNDKS
jgi:hypothetical protein